MRKIHDPDLSDNEKPLYAFRNEVISKRLIEALEYFHEVYKKENGPYNVIQLVPTDTYFISYRDRGWIFSEKVYITQEQVDKYLILFASLSMPFLEYMEIILDEGV